MISFICSVSIFDFFFFKQKTAYEMRISDWSSDVCSSDLARDQDRIQISFDRDHGDLIFGQGVPPPRAVVYLRLQPPLPEHLHTFASTLAALGTDALIGYFTVVSLQGLRQRPLPEPL